MQVVGRPALHGQPWVQAAFYHGSVGVFISFHLVAAHGIGVPFHAGSHFAALEILDNTLNCKPLVQGFIRFRYLDGVVFLTDPPFEATLA